jgi:hypothetical protein
MFDNPPLASFAFPTLGVGLMVLMLMKPQWFRWLSVIFTAYTILILYLTA